MKKKKVIYNENATITYIHIRLVVINLSNNLIMLLNDVKIKPDKSVKGILKVFGQELKALQMDLYDTLLQLLTSVCVRVCVRGSVQEW